MIRLIKTILLFAMVFGIVSLSYVYINLKSYSNDGKQSLEIWNKVIESEGYVDLIGRINNDHILLETKTSKLKEYLNNNKDLFTSIFTSGKEKKTLPYMYESTINEKKNQLSKFEFSKSLKFNKTNNMVKFRVTDKSELNEVYNSGILKNIFQPFIHTVSTGPTANVVSSPAAWNRDSSDVSYPDQGSKQEGNSKLIAIIDTGIENFHPYLLNKVIYEACFQDNEDDEDCPDGDTGSNSALPCPNKYTQCSHGTMMAGIAAGNGKNIKQDNNGIARNSDIFALKVFSTYTDPQYCGGPNGCAITTEAEYSQALDLVHLYNLYRKIFTLVPNALFQLPKMSAVNMSFGSGIFNNSCDGLEALKDVQTDIWELRYTYDVPTVIAAGNGFRSTSIGANGVSSPACLSDAYTVGATDNASSGATTFMGFSNGANGLIDISAPGDNTFSSLQDQKYTPITGQAGGTSGAAAHISGAFALLDEVFPLENFKVQDRFKVLNDVATPFNYVNFAGIINSPIPPFTIVGTGPIAGNSRRLFLCKDYERVATGDAGVDAPFNQVTWQCKNPPKFEPPASPLFNSDLFKIFRINCIYCPSNLDKIKK